MAYILRGKKQVQRNWNIAYKCAVGGGITVVILELLCVHSKTEQMGKCCCGHGVLAVG